MKSFLCKNLNETEDLAKKFADVVRKNGCFVCMFGDIGAGKTAFVKLAAKHLDVQEKVTSPSFVILNEYHSGAIPIFHFDLYRLESEGVKTILDELTEYAKDGYLTFAEWAEFSEGEIPMERLEIRINYIGETEREFEFTPFGQKAEEILEKLQ